jgi:TRAP-type C4-dicarboxylate transport system permease small subunit
LAEAADSVAAAGGSDEGEDMATIERLLRWLEIPINLLLWIALLAGLLMMLHVSVDVTARALYNHPLPGTSELVGGYYMVAICYLPWAWLTRHDNHIVAGVFERIGSRRFGYWEEVAVKVFMLLYVGVFCWQTGVRAVQQTVAGEVWEAAGGFVPIWPSRWLLPIASALMCIYLVLRIVRDAGRGYRPEDDAGGRA